MIGDGNVARCSNHWLHRHKVGGGRKFSCCFRLVQNHALHRREVGGGENAAFLAVLVQNHFVHRDPSGARLGGAISSDRLHFEHLLFLVSGDLLKQR